MRNRYLRLAVSLVAALAVSIFLVVSTGEKQTVYRRVVVVTRDTEPPLRTAVPITVAIGMES